VFEDHTHRDSEVVRMFKGLGFRVFSLGWAMRGPIVAPVEVGSLATGLDAPNFVATIAPEQVLSLCEPRGWVVLTKRLLKTARSNLPA